MTFLSELCRVSLRLLSAKNEDFGDSSQKYNTIKETSQHDACLCMPAGAVAASSAAPPPASYQHNIMIASSTRNSSNIITSTRKNSTMGGTTTPAFAGAPFDQSGSCLKHPEVKLTQKTTIDGGKVVYKELRRRCPKCSSSASSSSHNNKRSSDSPEMKRRDSHMSRQSAQSGGSSGRRERGRQPSNHSGPSSPNPSLARSSSRARARARSKSPSSPRERTRSQSRSRGGARSTSPSSRTRSSRNVATKSPGRSGTPARSGVNRVLRGKSSKKEFVTPFDGKGRCHYHSNVQLAKKKLTGGWKVLLDNCPKCIEDRYNEENSDNRSVASRRSTRSSRSVRSSGGKSRSGGEGSRKKLLSIKKDKAYECPFDSQGYCHRHSHVRLAKKKITGGWKILQNMCGECIEEDNKHDDNRSVCSRSSRMSRRSMASRSSRRSTGTNSKRSPGGFSAEDADETDSELSMSQSEVNQKKMVKKMNYTDDNGDEGLYTGYVNSQYKPHGSGTMVYNNGKKFKGEWCEGSRVHGKTSKDKSKKRTEKNEKRDRNKEPFKASGSKNGSSNATAASAPEKEALAEKQRHGSMRQSTKSTPTEKPMQGQTKQDALKEYKQLFNTAKVVKNMLFVDFYGDRGRYTGEVNDQNMPHGTGEITYDHGLVQEGMWTNGVMDEGSIVSGPKMRSGMSVSSSRRRARSKDP